MCLIIIAYQADSRYPLVVAANRDELYARPTDEANFWTDDPQTQQVLAGRDLLAGGTWLGISQGGRFAAVTNIRDPSQTEKKPRSRGELTRNFLVGEESAEQYCDSLISSFNDFAGYNLLIGDRNSLVYVNNQEEKMSNLEPGVHGLSNGLLNSPWPKVTQGRKNLQSLLDDENGVNTDDLISMMDDRTQAQDEDLPDTGVPIELERRLSSAFIHNDEGIYGTLCSSAVIFDESGDIRFAEQNYDASGIRTNSHFYQLLGQTAAE
ncbi:MAG: hypothetical protein COA96_01565 [SAR86 cluster bacterium]|uniref:NRDE family protein n=1 Tax=SAR86 cluster bacterium TaxID=2030880 RepID=A0A2A5B9R2_9GAMM|nr:MAG: hypothetical protein COA96_01565 [SAR86 cluster bacterium]